MTVSEALDIWAEACEKAGAPWYLYRETLLCGACLPDFPTDLACAQTVLFAKDLSAVQYITIVQCPFNLFHNRNRLRICIFTEKSPLCHPDAVFTGGKTPQR